MNQGNVYNNLYDTQRQTRDTCFQFLIFDEAIYCGIQNWLGILKATK